MNWLSYIPFSGSEGQSNSVVLAVLGAYVAGTSLFLMAINIGKTVTDRRPDGITFTNIPLLAWAFFLIALLLVLSIPIVACCLPLFAFTHDVMNIPDPFQETIAFILLQTMYELQTSCAVILPTFGIISHVITTSSSKTPPPPLLGAFLSIVWISLIVPLTLGFELFCILKGFSFPLITFLLRFWGIPIIIAVPSWVRALRNVPKFKASLSFIRGSIFFYAVGGLTSLTWLSPALGERLFPTFYAVAGVHHNYFMPAVFAIFAGFYYWFEELWGIKYNEFLGRLHFILLFIGVNITFFPMYAIGWYGKLERTYPVDSDPNSELITHLNELSSIGTAISIAGVLVFFVMLCHAFYYRKPAELYDPIKKSTEITEQQAQIHNVFSKSSKAAYVTYTEEPIKNFDPVQHRTPTHPFVWFVLFCFLVLLGSLIYLLYWYFRW
jgi:cytochrome c oxidase subunit 1